MKYRIALFVIWMAFAPFASSQSPDLKATFAEKRAELDAALTRAREHAGINYVSVLDKRLGQLQQQGNLDAVLAVKALKEQWLDANHVPAAPVAVDAQTEAARQRFVKASQAADRAHVLNLTKLLDRYVELLPGQIKSLTQQGALDQAVAVKGDLEQAQVELAELRSHLPVSSARPAGRPPRGAARFMRLHIDSGYSQREVQLAEIEFYQARDLLPMRVTDFASEYNQGSWAHGNVVDGNIRSGWANDDAQDEQFPQWFVLEHKEGKAFQLSRVRVHNGSQGAGNYRLKAFSVYTSPDGKRWQQCLAGELEENAEAGWTEFSCRPIGRQLTFE